MADDQKTAELDFEANATGEKLPLRAWLRLFSSVTMIEREIKSRLQADFGVSLARFDYLAQLNRSPEGAMTMGELGQCLMVTGGSITGLTDRLEGDGLVRRLANPTDRRSHIIELTPRGRAAFEEMARAHRAWLGDIFKSHDAASLRALMSNLDDVKSGVRAAIARREAAIDKES